MSTFETLVSTKYGRDIGKVVVNALVDKQISEKIEVSGISRLLRLKCPSFCSMDDVSLYKGMELMRLAPLNDKHGVLKESLQYRNFYSYINRRLFSSVIDNMSLEQIKTICQVYAERKFHSGLITLCLQYAAKKDPANYGLKFYLGEKTNNEV